MPRLLWSVWECGRGGVANYRSKRADGSPRQAAFATRSCSHEIRDLDPEKPDRIVTSSDGSIMRRVIAIAATGLSLAGCSSFSTDSLTSYFQSTPPTVQLQLESTPPGAEAKTSIGPSCKTPCSMTVTPPGGQFHGQLCPDQVPAGDGCGAGHQDAGRSSDVGYDQGRSQSGDRATAAGYAAKEQADAAEKAEKAPGSRGTGRGSLAIPGCTGPCAPTPVDPLIQKAKFTDCAGPASCLDWGCCAAFHDRVPGNPT